MGNQGPGGNMPNNMGGGGFNMGGFNMNPAMFAALATQGMFGGMPGMMGGMGGNQGGYNNQQPPSGGGFNYGGSYGGQGYNGNGAYAQGQSGAGNWGNTGTPDSKQDMKGTSAAGWNQTPSSNSGGWNQN